MRITAPLVLSLAFAFNACDDDAVDATPDADTSVVPDVPDVVDGSDADAVDGSDAEVDGSDASPDTSEGGDDILTLEIGEERPLTHHDVSVLFPLPTGPGQDLYWTAATIGRGGPLLPESEFARIGHSVTNTLSDDLEYAALRVLAVRFDPCFRVQLTSACQPQVRLVFQMLLPTGQAMDGAVHALYNVPMDELPDLTRGLRDLRSVSGENFAYASLGINPALAAQGLDGPYARGLRDVVLRFAGAGNLARVTFMTRTDARSGQWEFGGFGIGTWPAETDFPAPGPIPIVGTPETSLQMVTRRIADGFEYTVLPMFADATGHPGVSMETIRGLDAGARATVHAWAVRQQDPHVVTNDASDCAGCHLAGRIGDALEVLDPGLVTDEVLIGRAGRLVGEADGNGDNLRAFGYFGSAAVVSQRVANETRAVVEAFAEIE